MRRFPVPTWLRFLAALLMVAVTLQIRLWLGKFAGIDGPTFTLFFVAIIAAGWFGGIGPGIVASLTSTILVDCLFIGPMYSILGNPAGSDLRLGLFLAEGIFISAIIHAFRQSSAASRRAERNLRLIADNTSDVIFAYDMSRQLLYVNPAFETLTGNSINELLENPFMNYIHPDDSTRMQALFEGLFTGKRFKDVEYRIISDDGEVKWCRATWGPMLDEYANQIGVQGRETEITEQKRAQEMLRFLKDSSQALSGVEPVEMKLNHIARLAVAHYADWCVIDLVGENGVARTVCAVHADAQKQPWLAEIQRDYPPKTDVMHGRGRVLGGKPELIGVVQAEVLSVVAQDSRHFKLLQNLAPRSMVCVPLMVEGRPAGTLMFVSSESGRRYTQEDLEFSQDLAQRVAGTLQGGAVTARAG